MDITVKDIIEYLQKFHPDTKVYLDHDGWMVENNHKTPQDVLNDRGLFSHRPPKDGKQLDYLIINN